MRKTVDKLTWHEYNKAMPTKLGKFYGGVLMNKEDILKMSSFLIICIYAANKYMLYRMCCIIIEY